MDEDRIYLDGERRPEMKIIAYRGPFIEQGDDHPTLELDIQVAEPRPGWDGEHGAAVKIYGAEMMALMLPILTTLGVPEKPHYCRSWKPK